MPLRGRRPSWDDSQQYVEGPSSHNLRTMLGRSWTIMSPCRSRSSGRAASGRPKRCRKLEPRLTPACGNQSLRHGLRTLPTHVQSNLSLAAGPVAEWNTARYDLGTALSVRSGSILFGPSLTRTHICLYADGRKLVRRAVFK